ncbi:class I SAM-dependent methyltransferase [Iamia sp.]|uniref:class I SAM-dependent methyltransferase n=1 Tax=Iamia sp. TaxID=2722710 RepID=UPI002BC63CFE|nr:class I SAM-dependent methyltransferase [Iamia sp.]HXH56033.1 class I SAM-dependent methyltransferase [Iamia sp.]
MSERVRHPIFARIYARISGAAEAKGGAEHREELLAGLGGRVVEVGAGNGLNFGHYPDAVTEVVAVEPEPHLRQLAEAAATRVIVKVTVVDGTAASLPLDGKSCDAAVCSLVLCSVADQDAALREVRRVVRPGGELRFYEHVVDPGSRFARFQRRVDIVHPHVAGGCHVTRDTGDAISRAGFEITSIRRFRFAPNRLSTAAAPKILGTARAPRS